MYIFVATLFPTTTLDRYFPANSDFHFHVLNFLGICSVATVINCHAVLHVELATTIC